MRREYAPLALLCCYLMVDVIACSGASRWMFSFQPSFGSLAVGAVNVTQAVTEGPVSGPLSGPVSYPRSKSVSGFSSVSSRHGSLQASGPSSGEGEWVMVKGQDKPSYGPPTSQQTVCGFVGF